MNKIGIIIQARTGSSRLPNKILLPFYNEQCILELLLNRIKEKITDVNVVVATTCNLKDDQIVDICKKISCDVFRGSEDDVLDRFVNTAEYYEFDKIIRICADNPFLDIDGLYNMIIKMQTSSADYLCYSLSDGTPSILTHYGFWGEVVTLKALKKVTESTSDSFYKEHVTNYIYKNTDKFRIEKILVDKAIEKSNIRLTIDTKEDFILSANIYDNLLSENIKITPKNILDYIKYDDEILYMMKEQIKRNTKK